MKHDEIQGRRLLRDGCAKSRTAHSHSLFPFHFQRVVFTRDVVAVNARALAVRFEQRTDRIMTGNLSSTNKRRLNPLLVNLLSVAVLGKIALSGHETFLKFRLQTIADEVQGQTNGTSGVLTHLNRFQAGEFVEEPSAAGVHEHGIALDLEQLQRRDLLGWREGMGGLAGKDRKSTRLN